jgi:hypothetical protein
MVLVGIFGNFFPHAPAIFQRVVGCIRSELTSTHKNQWTRLTHRRSSPGDTR